MQWTTWGSQLVDSSSHSVVFDQWWGVMRLNAGIDDQRPFATPVLLLCERINAGDVGCRIGTSERHPEKIIQRPSRELAVVDEHDQRKLAEFFCAGRQSGAELVYRVCR